MPLDLTQFDAAREAFRRRAGEEPSSAGILGGAPAANQVTSTNPLASMAMRRMEGQGMNPQQPASRPGIQQLGKSAPGEAEIIIRALIQRLRSLAPTGQ